MNRKEFIKLASGAAAFATAGCATEAPKAAPKKPAVDAVTSATPVVKWAPFADAIWSTCSSWSFSNYGRAAGAAFGNFAFRAAALRAA